MKPIIFCTDMVQAIQEGRKTMTRRIISRKSGVWGDVETDGRPLGSERCGDWYDAEDFAPYQPGDILWVRETWRCRALFPDTLEAGIEYKDGTERRIAVGHSNITLSDEWRPSIHMPREAARIFLEVKSVRVERLQNISEEDAKAEGSYLDRCECLPRKNDKTSIETLFIQEGCHIHGMVYRKLWDTLNFKRGYGWDVNPWVWVYEFEQVKEP